MDQCWKGVIRRAMRLLTEYFPGHEKYLNEEIQTLDDIKNEVTTTVEAAIKHIADEARKEHPQAAVILEMR